MCRLLGLKGNYQLKILCPYLYLQCYTGSIQYNHRRVLLGRHSLMARPQETVSPLGVTKYSYVECRLLRINGNYQVQIKILCPYYYYRTIHIHWLNPNHLDRYVGSKSGSSTLNWLRLSQLFLSGLNMIYQGMEQEFFLYFCLSTN